MSAILGGVALLTICAAAVAQTKKSDVPAFGAALTTVAGGPDMTSETYGDWIMRCAPKAEAKPCEVSQTIMLQGQSTPIALIAFGRQKKGEPLRMVIQLPTNITLDGGVKAHTSKGDTTVDLKLRRCFPAGCFAEAPVTDAVLTKLKSQIEPLSVKFKDGTERDISLPFSPRGLAPALDALSKL
jgi:invasion protein IalB